MTAVRTSTQAAVPFARKRTLFVAYDGSDSNDGLDEHTPFATVNHAVSVATASSNRFADIIIMPGVFSITDTLVIPQAVRFRGAMWQGDPQGTTLVWNGTDDGRPWIQTATGTTFDWSTGLIEGFTLVATSTQTSGAPAIDVRNGQNASVMREVKVGTVSLVSSYKGPSGPAFDVTQTGLAATGEPGFIQFERCWSVRNKIGFQFVPVFTQVVMTMCAADGPKSGSGDAAIKIIADTNAHPPRAEDGVLVLNGFKFEGDSAVPMHGISSTQAVSIVINGGVFKTSGPTTSDVIHYDATLSALYDLEDAVPLVLNQVSGQGFTNWLYAPQQGITIPMDNTGGRTLRRSYTGAAIPGIWDGTHKSLDTHSVTVNTDDPAVSGVSIGPIAAQTAPLVNVDGFVFIDTYTRADSASTLGSSELGGGAYTAQRGTWGVTSDTAYLVGAIDDSSVIVDCGVADGTIICDITLNTTTANVFPGIQFRHVDINNTLLVRFKGSTGEMLLQKRVASVQSQLSIKGGVTYTGSSTHTVKIILAGASIKVYWDGVLQINYTLTAPEQATFLTPTIIGLRTNGLTDSGVTGSRYDNFLVTKSVTSVDPYGKTTAPTYSATGLPGATAGGRFAGATTSGAPVAGTFLVGDFVVTQNGHIAVCTVAGSPGTWTVST